MERAKHAEMAVCELFNRGCQSHQFQNFFIVISWLGDGKAWYVLMITLPVIYGKSGLLTAGTMVKVGLINLAVYKIIKRLTSRQRPCAVNAKIHLGTAPLDQYSFPSGHTMHAVAFSMIATAYHPELSCLLVPFSTLIALSRIVLGLHYPTDVFAGGAIGGYVASYFLHFLAT